MTAYYNKGNTLYKLNRYNEAINCYEKCVELNPSYIKEFNNKGIAFKNLNRFEDDDDGPSDTRNYVEKVLIPYLTSTDHGNGHGDINHPFTKFAMNKFFPGGNRGILICNDQPFVLLGDWKEIKNSNGDTIKTSNTDYFDEVNCWLKKNCFGRYQEICKQKNI